MAAVFGAYAPALNIPYQQRGERPPPPGGMSRRTASIRRGAAARRKVLFVTTEITDFVKAGGLGDVSAALPRALRGSQNMRVLIPGYRSLLQKCGAIRHVGKIRARAGMPACEVGEITRPDGLRILVLLHPELYERDGTPYEAGNGSEWADNGLRFATLSHAAAEIAEGHASMRWRPQLVHLNDWPCALTAAYLKWRGSGVPTLLTIHNLAYQGLFPHTLREKLGMPQDPELDFHGKMSFLRGGLAHADYVTTVSRCYAGQITLPEYGCGLHELLQQRMAQGRLIGIVNGIDDSWDPTCDPALAAHFSADRQDGRERNTDVVRREFHLLPSNGPLFSVVARLVHQKGLDLICDAAPQIVAAGGQIAIIGRGEPRLERRVTELARRFHGQVAAQVGFSEAVARRMFAGSDFLLMPSRFEPCGLSQMYAQCYGSLPIAHATGGLVDTIDDGVTGLLFNDATVGSLRRSLQRAFRIHASPSLLHAMRRAAMVQPHDWAQSCQRYVALYERAAPVKASVLYS